MRLILTFWCGGLLVLGVLHCLGIGLSLNLPLVFAFWGGSLRDLVLLRYLGITLGLNLALTVVLADCCSSLLDLGDQC